VAAYPREAGTSSPAPRGSPGMSGRCGAWRRDRRFDRGARREGRFRLLTSNDRPRPSRAGPAGHRGGQASLRRQADGRLPRGRHRAFRRGSREEGPLFSASSLRWIPRALELRNGPRGWSKAPTPSAGPLLSRPIRPLLVRHPRRRDPLYRYGTGCLSVSRFRTEDTEFLRGPMGRGADRTFRGSARASTATGNVFAEKKIEYLPMGSDYTPMLKAIAQFFATGRPPSPRKRRSRSTLS